MKIDQNGEYLPFAGVTVISPVVQENTTFWSELHNTLTSHPVLVKYFTPLPYESYHMTTNNLCVQASHDDWHAFIDRNLLFFKQLSAELIKNDEFLPLVTITGITTEGAIQLSVNFSPPDQEDAIINLAKTYNYTSGIPSQFHITLAYQYKKINHEDKPAFDAAIQAIRDTTRNCQITLNPPGLHTFNDMTHYTPWDGNTNPFQPDEDNSHTFFF